MKKLIAGNWKMNGSLEEAKALAAGIVNGLHEDDDTLGKCDILVCPPFVHIGAVRHALHDIDYVSLGAQNCSRWEKGAHTGNVSAPMLTDCGCSYVILGHSERRQNWGEKNEVIAEKIKRAHENGLIAILCVGETLEQREAGEQEAIVGAQLAQSLHEGATSENTVVAYEPVWAIGTGEVASVSDVEAMHSFIREQFSGRILYGGSMKPENAAELLNTPNVDGGLIGGASLKVEDFLAIARAA